METLENKKRYKWTSGPRYDMVETYIADDDQRTYFESGRSIDKDQLEINLREISEEEFQDRVRFQAKEAPPLPPMSQAEIASLASLDPTLVIEAEKPPMQLGNPEEEVIEVQPIIQAVTVAEQNPIKIILDKQRKKESITLLVDFQIDVPSKKVLELLDVMFDRDEVIEEIIKSSTEKINTQTIIEQITESIKLKVASLFEDEEKDDTKNEMQTS
jgi:hypothetical protein